MLKEDSLYFLLQINLYDLKYQQAEENYKSMLTNGNINSKLAAESFSNHYSYKDRKKALDYYRQYFKFDAVEYIDSKQESYYMRKVDRYFLLLDLNHKYDTILIYCDSILPYKPNDVSWLNRKAEALYYLQKYEEAAETYCKLYELNNDFESVQDLIRVYKKLDDTLSVISLLSENAQKDDKDIDIRHLFYQYLDHYKLRNLKADLINEVLKNGPDYYLCYVPSEKYFYFSLFQFYNNQLDEAIITLYRGIERIDSDTMQRYSPFKSMTVPANYSNITEYYVYSGEGDMFKSKYYDLIGYLYRQKGKTNKAVKSYEKSLFYFDCNYSANYALAYIYKYNFLRNRKKAILFYEKIVSCDLFGFSRYYAISQLARIITKKNNLRKPRNYC